MKQIKIPIGFEFKLQNIQTGQIVSAPVAFQGINWRVWPNAPKGIEYEILDKKLPQNWQYTVGPDAKVIRWNSEIWEPWSKWETIEDCQPQGGKER